MKKQIVNFLFLFVFCFTAVSQNLSADSDLKPGTTGYTFVQTETIDVYYDNENYKFVIQNNSKQIRYFTLGIYNLTGTPVKETKCECINGKTFDIPVTLNPGLYIVNVTDKQLSFTKKFLIK